VKLPDRGRARYDGEMELYDGALQFGDGVVQLRGHSVMRMYGDASCLTRCVSLRKPVRWARGVLSQSHRQYEKRRGGP
jgi:hypothetical protein